jgi:hypothetical protein
VSILVSLRSGPGGEGGCFHRPGCRALTSVAVATEMIGAGGWPVVCRDLTARCGAR